VPLLNLSVRAIDRLVRPLQEMSLWKPASANLAHIATWVAFFALMTSLGKTDGTHRGDILPFWEEACAEGRARACERLLQIESTYCGDHSGWACNELGRHYRQGALTAADPERALAYFSRACELRFQPGCVNLVAPEKAVQANPRVLDLRLLLREGGLNLMDTPEPELYARACEHRWKFACDKVTSLRSSGAP
jgi:hypothetical protein